jgi:hypothetical protein
MGMVPCNLVISLDSGEHSSLTPYKYCALITMLWLLLDCDRIRFNCFCMFRDSSNKLFQRISSNIEESQPLGWAFLGA